MNNPNHPETELFWKLDEQLLRILLQHSSKFARVAHSPITVELFLAALYASAPEEVSAYFEDVAPLRKLVKSLSEITIGTVEIAPAATNAILNQVVDSELIRILQKARQKHDRVTLSDFMEEITHDSAISDWLLEKRNLLIRKK